jgi:hypothetical protein
MIMLVLHGSLEAILYRFASLEHLLRLRQCHLGSAHGFREPRVRNRSH